MELKQSTMRQAQRQPQVLVRVGTQQWVMGGAAADAKQEPVEKVISLSNVTSAAQSENSRWRESRVSRLLWSLQKWVYETLDKLLDPRAIAEDESTRSERVEGRREAHRLRRSVSIKGSFQTGVIFGLLLGCLSLILFHQLEPTYPTPVKVSYAPTVAHPRTGPAIVLPAVRLYVLHSSVLSSQSYAQAVQRKLQGHGILSAIHHTSEGYTLLYQVAAYSADLLKGHQRLADVGYRSDIGPFQWNTTQIPTLTHLSRPNADAISHWLSNEVSALNALTATISDNAPGSDAITAMKTARQSMPSDHVLSGSGYGSALRAFRTSINQAFDRYQRHELDSAVTSELSAYSKLYQLQNAGKRT